MIINHIDTEKQVLVIAEIGNNHGGSYSQAEEMVGRAADAGASAIKFQTIIPEKLVSPQQKERIDQLRKFCLSYSDFERLAKVAAAENILFLSTPFDIESVKFLNRLVPAFKIASGDNNFFPLIEVISQTAKPVIVSSGMTDLQQISRTKEFIEAVWKINKIQQEMAILHCVSSYPTRNEDANLLAIRTLQTLGVTVGYSDHTVGVDAAVIAVALGARIVEKHFTLNKNSSSFRDHHLSADPSDFREMVEKILSIEILLGSCEKRILECERENVSKARRSIVSDRDLKKGHILSWDDLAWVRPATGLPPGDEGKIVGKVINTNLPAGQNILPDHVRA